MSYSIHMPLSLQEALDLKRKTGGTYLGAGTVILVNHRHEKNLISLEKIPGLSSIEESEDYVKIGSLVTFDELENSPVVKKKLPALWQAAYNTAGPQIRNRATIGGNIGCFSPASDAVTALMALDAELELFDGATKRVKLENTDSLSNEAIISAVYVPKRYGFSAFEKVGKRSAMSVSVLNMAIARDKDGVRLAIGCAAPKVLLCKATSETLSRKPLDLTEAEKCLLSEILPIDDRWGTVSYRRAVAVNLLKKLVKESGL